jgi:hypothetical protein
MFNLSLLGLLKTGGGSAGARGDRLPVKHPWIDKKLQGKDEEKGGGVIVRESLCAKP